MLPLAASLKVRISIWLTAQRPDCCVPPYVKHGLLAQRVGDRVDLPLPLRRLGDLIGGESFVGQRDGIAVTVLDLDEPTVEQPSPPARPAISRPSKGRE